MKVRHPNMVFVFSDQQSFDMLGCEGNALPHVVMFGAIIFRTHFFHTNV